MHSWDQGPWHRGGGATLASSNPPPPWACPPLPAGPVQASRTLRGPCFLCSLTRKQLWLPGENKRLGEHPSKDLLAAATFANTVE